MNNKFYQLSLQGSKEGHGESHKSAVPSEAGPSGRAHFTAGEARNAIRF